MSYRLQIRLAAEADAAEAAQWYLRATEITLAEETLKRLDEIFPGQGGEAPEACAW
jgi:hypothetical protein